MGISKELKIKYLQKETGTYDEVVIFYIYISVREETALLAWSRQL